jgi:ribosome-binding protein aMBF1 (putative translation factor)
MKFEDVAKFLNEERKRKKINYKTIARFVDTNPANVENLMKAKHCPKFDLVEKVANYLGLELYPICLEED